MSGDTTPEGSPLRHLMGTVDGGAPYRPLATLADARATDDGIVVLEGDEGGQIYVVVPARHVHCDERAVRALLVEIDRTQWNEPEMARVVFERAAVGTGVAGGMGGGLVTDGVWVHPDVARAGLLDHIVAVLAGE